MDKTVPIQWGGYYTSKNEDGLYSLFRLLDFTREAYHAAIFQEKFTRLPTWSDVQDLAPFIGHVPISSQQFYHQEMKLIGGTPLKPEDLEGYEIYLDHLQCSREEIEEIRGELLQNSQFGPLMVKLSLIGDRLRIQPIT